MNEDKKTTGSKLTKQIIVIIGIVVIAGGILFSMNYRNSSVNIDENAKHNTENIEKDTSNEEVGSGEAEDIVEEDDGDLAIGKLAPNFTLKNLEGKEVSLSDYKGKIVILNFWATWCKFCDIEMPDLNDLDKDNDDVVVLAVDVMEEHDKVKKYIDKGGYEFEVVLDSKGDISRNYLVSAYPTTYAINKEGILMGGVPGMMTKPQMEQIVESVRSGK